MKKTIITIERQYGSGGSIIGKLAADKLGINCYNRQILEMTAQRCGIAPEYLENAEEKGENPENVKRVEGIANMELARYDEAAKCFLDSLSANKRYIVCLPVRIGGLEII